MYSLRSIKVWKLVQGCVILCHVIYGMPPVLSSWREECTTNHLSAPLPTLPRRRQPAGRRRQFLWRDNTAAKIAAATEPTPKTTAATTGTKTILRKMHRPQHQRRRLRREKIGGSAKGEGVCSFSFSHLSNQVAREKSCSRPSCRTSDSVISRHSAVAQERRRTHAESCDTICAKETIQHHRLFTAANIPHTQLVRVTATSTTANIPHAAQASEHPRRQASNQASDPDSGNPK